jgi:thiamine pyrophosphate-dependent acetolactate synthase large subunit-like protein
LREVPLMQELVRRYLDRGLSRRGFVRAMSALGFTAAAAEAVLAPLDASEQAASEQSAAQSTDLSAAAGTSNITGSGGDLCIAQAKAAGAEYLFTNPGSFETGFFDAFTDTPGMQLIMGLHEGIVVSMADGYHRVSRKPAFVNVHAAGGTAQMGGQLFNASRDGSALVITAGLSDNENFSDESVLAPRPGFDQKEIPRQFTKIAWEARKPESIPVMMRRAFKVASTEPGGPVYLAMADYALEAKNATAQILPADRFLIRARVRPDAADVEKAAKWLIQAKRPVVIVGDEVWKSGAQAHLLALSERLGLPVASSDAYPNNHLEGYCNFPLQHPHYIGAFSIASEYIRKTPDLIVFIGARDVGGVAIPRTPGLPTEARVIRIGIDTNSMSRNYATDLALVADVKEALIDLGTALDSALPKDRAKTLREERSTEVRAFTKARGDRLAAAVKANLGKPVIHADELNFAMARHLEPNSIVVSENLTGKCDSFNLGFRDDEMMWVSNTGHSLGWGLGASIGAAIASPKRPVVCSIGDGSVMYSASAFWTMARYSVPVLTIVWNNHNYQTVRHAYSRYRGKMEQNGHYAGMYLGAPEIDFVKLAESQGVGGEKVTKGADLEAAIKRGTRAARDGKPYLIDVLISCYGGGAESTWYEKFSVAERRKQLA